ncbi:MAG TPA: DUF924 family protein [Myxococcota bacterium]|nr:DUF924 family protein [Myxococcota bacterium]
MSGPEDVPAATASPQALLDFWLGDAASHPTAAAARMEFWFEATPETDAAVRGRFAGVAEAARRGELAGWRDTPRGRLALVIALDQLPRNLHRGAPEAFASDDLALVEVRRAIEVGALDVLTPIETGLLLLPLSHAEDVAAQQESVARAERLAQETPPAWRPLLESFAESARRHRDVVRRFGRFPHRNAILGRASTPAEAAFLASGAADFGQRSPIELRPFADAELDSVCAMWSASKREAFPYVDAMQAHTPEQDRAFFRDVLLKESAVWIAWDGDEVVGMLAQQGPVVGQLFVAVGRQRSGIGTRLLAHAKTLSPAGLRLYTFQKNEPARRFYEKHGFQATRFGVSDPPESEPDVEYTWRPSPPDAL